MTKPNAQYAYFTITSSYDPAAAIASNSFDPALITKRLGVVPSKSWRKGDLHPKTRLERKFSRWSLRSRLPETEDLEAHIANVLAQMDQNPEPFISVSKEYGGCMQLVGYFHEMYPGLHFDAPLIQGLARYGLSVDCDFYYLWSNSREDT